MPTPLLIISDAPTSGTGLGRITRDLAVRIAANLKDEFRVGTLGYGGTYSRALDFPQYVIEGMENWVLPILPEVWQDFAGEEKGILLTIWDASRLLWLSRPENCGDPRLRRWLQAQRPELWGYFPVDATGVNDKLTGIIKHTIEGYNRVLAYSNWAADILKNTLGDNDGLHIEALPHGIDTSVFYPRNRTQARHGFGQRIGAKNLKGKKTGQPVSIADDALLIGIVATNQVRKDWGLGISTVAELAKERNVVLWIHTDVLERHWSIPALLYDFGLQENAIVTIVDLSDEQMAWAYSACDVTLGIGLGEGFGYPIFESLACGTPCIHGNYGGAAEHMPPEMLVHAEAERIEGPYNCVRQVYFDYEWKDKVIAVSKLRTELPAHLDWNALWPRWAEWLKAGLK